MHRVALNRCLNKERKYYGLTYLGIIGAGIIGFLVWLRFGMTIGIMGSVIGYGVCAYWAKLWHIGLLQRLIYWHLPLHSVFGGRYLPASHKRCWL
jgi:hypothetical protein